MARFLVTFNGPVVDQPDHRKVNREVRDGLPVSAPDATTAVFHAARVTTGVGVPVACYDAQGRRVWGEGPETITLPAPAAPLIEHTTDRTEVFGA
jgi:hypothetical protein